MHPMHWNDLPTTIPLARQEGKAFVAFNGNVWDVERYGQGDDPQSWLVFRRGSGWDTAPADETNIPEGRWMAGYQPAVGFRL